MTASMTGRSYWNQRNTRGHRPRLLQSISPFCNTLFQGGVSAAKREPDRAKHQEQADGVVGIDAQRPTRYSRSAPYFVEVTNRHYCFALSGSRFAPVCATKEASRRFYFWTSHPALERRGVVFESGRLSRASLGATFEPAPRLNKGA